jgi:hypothetical protein
VMQAPDAYESAPRLLSRKPDPQYVAAVLDEWMEGDAEEQRETFELLKRSLDEGPAGEPQAVSVSLVVLLDAGPVGMVTNPKSSPQRVRAKRSLRLYRLPTPRLSFRSLPATKSGAS